MERNLKQKVVSSTSVSTRGFCRATIEDVVPFLSKFTFLATEIILILCFIQTTLFQTKMLDEGTPSIFINDATHSLKTDLTKIPFSFGTENQAATLTDVNGK